MEFFGCFFCRIDLPYRWNAHTAGLVTQKVPFHETELS